MCQNNLKEILGKIQDLSDHVLSIAVILAAIGTISMAFLELFNALTFARLFFNKYMIRSWLKDSGNLAYDELITLAAGGRTYANSWFNQPSDLLMATLRSSANIALNYPKSYLDFYAFLVRDVMQEQGIADGDELSVDASLWLEVSTQSTTTLDMDDKERMSFIEHSRKGNDARLRLAHI